MSLYWTFLLRTKLLLIGVNPKGCVATGRVVFHIGKGANIKLEKNVFFRGSNEIKIRNNGNVILGQNVRLDFGVRITVALDYTVSLGDRVEVGYCTLINAGENIKVESGAAIGGHCVLQSSEHIVEPSSEKSVVESRYRRGEIFVGAGAWLSSFVVVRPGIKIANNSVVGAFSMVSENVPPGTLFAGVPAVFKKNL